jgi:hypothetical protein
VDKIALGDDDYYIFHVSVFSFLEDITTILFQYNLRSDSSVLQVFWLIGTCSFGLSATTQQYFSPRTNQSSATSQQYFSLRTNQHQPTEQAVGYQSPRGI